MQENNHSIRKGRTDAVPLSDEEMVSQVVVATVENLWEAVNQLTRLKKSKKEEYMVTIFGSARIMPETHDYDRVRKLAKKLSEMGCGVITGGGPGLMQAANEGVADVHGHGSHRSVGIRVDLPFEQNANPFVGKVYNHKTFFSRLHHFMIISDAFIVVPGGIGTLLELSMVWQLLQVRRLYGTPLILVGEMWEKLVDWARIAMVESEHELASSVDLTIPTCVKSSQEAIELIEAHRKEWLESED
ncbi:MAG: LOG family protein [Candidatus Obscuribacterales bacterium]|nr:LOG family protein [Cyanobacteria bacterium HKST-UBA01]MCB9469393.1 LOG family protein [Candidatus Obscuribacterales bacterium]